MFLNRLQGVLKKMTPFVIQMTPNGVIFFGTPCMWVEHSELLALYELNFFLAQDSTQNVLDVLKIWLFFLIYI